MSVGILDSVTDLVAEELVSDVRRRYPNVRLRVFTAFAGQLRSWLYDGELDVALLFGVTDQTALKTLPVASEAVGRRAERGCAATRHPSRVRRDRPAPADRAGPRKRSSLTRR